MSEDDIQAAIAESKALQARQGHADDGAGPSSAPDAPFPASDPGEESGEESDGDRGGGVVHTVHPPSWRPTDEWAKNNRLWCPKSGTLQEKRRISYHAKTCVDCPLVGYKEKELVTYVKDGADERCQCTCGALLQGGKLNIREKVTRHLRSAQQAHPSLQSDPEARRRKTIEVMGTHFKKVTLSLVEAKKGTSALFADDVQDGEPDEEPNVPDNSNDAATLFTSVRVLGLQSEHWMTANILGDHLNKTTRTKYVGAIRSLLSAARLEGAKDWRYILADENKLTRLRLALNKRMRENPSHGERTATGLKRLLKELQASLSLPELKDGKRREWRLILSEVRDINDRERSIGAKYKTQQRLDLEEKKESEMATTEQRLKARENVLTWMRSVMDTPPEEVSEPENVAQIFRQAVYILLSLFSGHRTGVITGITCSAVHRRTPHHEQGTASIIFKHGKTKKTSGCTTVVIPLSDVEMLTYYIRHQRPLLTSPDDDQLLSGFRPYAPVHPALNPEQLDYKSMMSGNINRSYHLLQSEHLKNRQIIDS